LGRTGELAAGDALLRALEAPADEAERLLIVAALGQVKAAAAAGPLRELLGQAAESVLRAQIVVALGAIRDGSSRPTLVEMLEDPVPAVRYLAVESLHAMGARDAAAPIDALGQELTGQIRHDAADWSAHAAALVVQARTLVAVLRALIDLDPATGETTMLEAAKLPAVDAPAAAALAVETALFECRRVALHGLGYVPSAAAVELLQGPQGLGHADYRIRAIAARSLAVQGGPAALDRLLPSLQDRSAEVRWTAALGLGRLADRRAVQPLLEHLSDSSARVRREASLALGYLGDPAAKSGLQALASADEAEPVRAAAAYALRLIDRPTAP
jgi:HEAT repeat protein